MSIAEIIAGAFGLVIIGAVLWNFRGSRPVDNDHENWKDGDYPHNHGSAGHHD